MSNHIIRVALSKETDEVLMKRTLSGHHATAIIAKEILAERQALSEAPQEVVEEVVEPTEAIAPEVTEVPKTEAEGVVEPVEEVVVEPAEEEVVEKPKTKRTRTRKTTTKED